MSVIALIPARSGSKRIPNKNIKLLAGHPLLAYAIQAAIDSEIFEGIYCSSDSPEILKIAEYYGAKGILCRLEIAHKDNDPDVKWIEHAIKYTLPCDAFAIVRPTNPFRTGETIKRGWRLWNKETCMKAIERVSQHPGKMWISKNEVFIKSFLPGYFHLGPTQILQDIFIQNASLEFRSVLKADGKDDYYQPFHTKGYEGFDINGPDDWILAEALIKRGLAKLPEIRKEPYENICVDD